MLSVAGLSVASALAIGSSTKAAGSYTAKPDCSELPTCTEVANPQEAFGNYYVGHDEPSTEFYSSTPGSGNNNQYQLTIPSDPSGKFSTKKGYNFELHPAFWFGMAMCDTFSFPEQTSTCTPDSDTNIVNPATTGSFAKAPGAAFMELQFYPPGWIPQFAGSSCDAKKWCVALNIDSLSEDPINGTTLNSTCQSHVLGGIEYINFAFLTLNGTPLGPPDPLDFNPSTSGNPNNANTFFLNSGDRASVTLTDTSSGFTTTVHDKTTGQTGSMVSSVANGFGHITYGPTGSSCTNVPYTFHPMYSTSGPTTRVLWAAHTYNVAFSDEIGHFDFCTHINANTGACDGLEGGLVTRSRPMATTSPASRRWRRCATPPQVAPAPTRLGSTVCPTRRATGRAAPEPHQRRFCSAARKRGPDIQPRTPSLLLRPTFPGLRPRTSAASATGRPAPGASTHRCPTTVRPSSTRTSRQSAPTPGATSVWERNGGTQSTTSAAAAAPSTVRCSSRPTGYSVATERHSVAPTTSAAGHKR